MGTTLTGTTPQDTYDSLIKVTDNGPLSGTAKFLSDGLGNDSVLALSTAAAGIGTTTIVSGTKLTVGGPLAAVGSAGTMGTFETSASACFIGLKDASGSLVYLGGDDGNFLIQTPSSSYSTKLTLTDAGNVGIGTSEPETKLNLVGGNIRLNTGSGTIGTSSSVEFSASANNSVVSAEIRSTRTSGGGADFKFFTTTSVGVAPTEKLSILEGGGITFNGDTAAANALDDYEEGTFTCTVNVGSGSVTVDTTVNQGRYTKIGNVVSVQGRMKLTAVSSPSGNWSIDLPFTVASYNANGANEGVGSCVASNIDFGTNTMISAIPDRGSALCFFIACGDNSAQIQLNGTHLSATSDLYFQTTYITA
jgi:hypothetical protein